jgi:large subunit ribosomal protein L21
MNIAIIKTGGKQYLVKEGDKLKIEKLVAEAGQTVTFETLLTWRDGKLELEPKGRVEAEVLGQKKDKKVTVFKYKSKIRYRRTKGHRQQMTEVRIGTINI